MGMREGGVVMAGVKEDGSEGEEGKEEEERNKRAALRMHLGLEFSAYDPSWSEKRERDPTSAMEVRWW